MPEEITAGHAWRELVGKMWATLARQRWALIFLGAPAFVAIWAGWVGLGKLTGFGVVQPFPGIWEDFHLNTAITLPIGVETYAAYATKVWLARQDHRRASQFAKWSAIGSLILGALGQVAFHLMTAAGITEAPWWITTIVACLPVVVFGMGAVLAHLLHLDATEAARELRAEEIRKAEAEAARAQAEADAAKAALEEAEATVERERLRLERMARQEAGKQARKTTGTAPRKTPEVVSVSTPGSGPETAPDLQRRAAVKAAFLAAEGGSEPWTARKLATEYYGVTEPSPKQIDSARKNAQNWRRDASSSGDSSGVEEVAR